MNFIKPPLTVHQQITLLEQRGMCFRDKSKSVFFLSRVGYFRLSGYFYLFQNKDNKDIFQKDTYFEDIEKYYVFDQKLRILLMEAIERIETAFCAALSAHMSTKYHSGHWFLQEGVFRNDKNINKYLRLFTDESQKSHEIFIKKYLETYSSPSIPPSWMILEILSFGNIIYLFNDLKKEDQKQILINSINIPFVTRSKNLNVIRVLRNTCAHHQRVFNKNFSFPVEPPHFLKEDFYSDTSFQSYIKIIAYIMKNIGFDTSWGKRVSDLLNEYKIDDSENTIYFLENIDKI